MSAPAEALAAADAWALDHGCRDISFCCKTPQESFQAGWDLSAAAERERLLSELTERATTLIRPSMGYNQPEGVRVVLMRDVEALAAQRATEKAS